VQIRSIVDKQVHQWVRSPGFRRFFRTIELPESLEDVTTRDKRSELAADVTDLDPQLVATIWSAVENLYATAYYPAIHFCLRHKGKILLNRSIGHSSGNEPGVLDAGNKILAKPSTPACLFSSSKAITAALVHKAAEEGYLNLLDPISHYIPEFGRQGKDRITIYQLLCHRAGIPGVEPGTPADIIFDHQACVDLLCNAKPIDEFGRKQAYHAVTGGYILREILERTTGKDIRVYWDEKFKTPMGFKVFDYGADDAVYASMSRDAATGARLPGLLDKFFEKSIGSGLDDAMALVSERRFFSEPIPSANMVTTAEEVSRFYQMLLDQGKHKRRNILDPLTVHRLTWETGPHKFDNQLKVPMRFTPGMMMGASPYGIFGRNSTNAYGHLGLLNTLTWADPDRQISVAMITTGKPVIAHNLPSLLRVLNAVTAIPVSKRQ
jgi:CubicO group peptidase (beta-lactamase class C family)